MSSEDEADLIGTEPELEDDLFGDADEDQPVKPRELSDEELDSGDDEDRDDRAKQEDGGYNASDDKEQLRIEEKTLWRHPLPQPLDGEFNTLRLPKFLGIEPRTYDPENFTIPINDHHSDSRSSDFSASATSASTMRYRKNMTTGDLESNTVLYKWSDGSTTIGVGDQHYELQTKPMAPARDKPYQEVMDSHSYMASPSVSAQVLVIFGHLTNQYTVRPNKDVADDALERLQKGLAAAARGGKKGNDQNGPELITNTQDPELQKKQAELAEKERLRAQRRRETAAEKASISSRGRAGGLTVDDLEGRSGRRAPAGRKPGGVKRPRRRDDYDTDDEDQGARGRGREDEYDKEDDFLADSDEELEEAPEGDDDEEEEILDDSDEPQAKKHKPSRPEETSDVDAEADLDDDEAPAPPVEAPAARGRAKRNVIEDDEDDE